MPSSTPQSASRGRGPHRSPLRYLLAGGLLFILDFAVTRTLYVELRQPLDLAQWVGRLAGAGAGYWVHRFFTFQVADQLIGTARLRYWLVAAGLWFISPLLLRVATTAMPDSLLLAKIAIECVLVSVSYLLLRHFVFQSTPKP